MNNEIGRKITSLTLMTIMLAAGFTAFAPSVMPQAAAANANLFVSAENSQFQNYFAGPQVIEVVVIDSDIKDTDKGKGEPDVTVNGKKLRMIQAVDGNWYGYFADRNQAQIADQTVAAAGVQGVGLDFGSFCSNTSTVTGFSVSETVGIAIPTDSNQGTQGTAPITGVCTVANTNTTTIMNVIREPKEPNNGTGTAIRGQIGLAGKAAGSHLNDPWPFIQLFNLNPTGNVVVQYNKGGGVQSTTLKFDTVDQFAKLQLDRASYPRSAQVHVTVTDIQLNVDPTDEDSWTFATNATQGTKTVYQTFNENGEAAGDGVAGGNVDITGSLANLMFEDNGILKLNTNAAQGHIVRIQDNDDSRVRDLTAGAGTFANATANPKNVITSGSATSGVFTQFNQPITITESGPNTGVFGTYDESDKSVLVIASGAPRGQSATIDYNKKAQTILVGFGFASIDIKPTDVEWNSGEEIPVVLTDSDANKNSRADEDLDVNNPDVELIPALSTGDPFTLGEAGGVEPGRVEAIFVKNFTGTSTLGKVAAPLFGLSVAGAHAKADVVVQKFSERALLTPNKTLSTTTLIVDLETTADELRKSINDPRSSVTPRFHGFNLLNLDLRGINSTITSVDVYLLNSTATNGPLTKYSTGQIDVNLGGATTALSLVNGTAPQSLVMLNETSESTAAQALALSRVVNNLFDMKSTDKIGLMFNFTRVSNDASVKPIIADFFSFGFKGDGTKKSDRVNNQIIRVEAEETGDNTGVFEGTLEYIMLNQLNILDHRTYLGLTTIADDPTFIVHQDLDDEESPRISYNDRGADGVVTQVSDQQAAPAHSGVVSFDKPTYKKADTVIVTLQDQDLNTDVDLIDIYTFVDVAGDPAQGTIGRAGLFTLATGDPLGRLLDITFDDQTWRTDSNSATATNIANKATCVAALVSEGIDTGIVSAGFTLIETGPATGIFTGGFQVPGKVCLIGDSTPRNTQGLDMEVNYVDFRDASGQIIEVGDGAGIRANTGSVSLDRTVYPVPWGTVSNFVGVASDETVPDGRSIFPVHLTAVGDNAITAPMTLGDGSLTIHVQVNDPDFDVSAAGEDVIAENATTTTGADAKRGPVKVTVSRGNAKVTLAYAGGPIVNNGLIDVGDNAATNQLFDIRQLGPITETSPSSGIFEFDLEVRYTDGPASSDCPTTAATGFASLRVPGTLNTANTRFDAPDANNPHCILQGDIITVEYTDPADASGRKNTVTDSATFDLRNGALQSDKSVYIIGSDMILTLIEPDFDLDNDLAETYDLDLIEWDSDAATLTMGDLGGQAANFDPEPSDLRETGDSTGIFQAVIEIPRSLNNDALERGEEIVLEYTDWGPSGAKYVGAEDEDINLTIFTSNFGATVELDQKVYTWTDKVYITVVAPDHNFDSNLIDEIGGTQTDPLRVATRGDRLDRYRLTETGTDTGIFTGEVILTGFQPHDADGDGDDTDAPATRGGAGPTNGFLQARDDDGLTVSYEFSEDETVVGSALIRWNIGEVMWLEASYPASGTGVVRVIDPDMNLNPEAVDNFKVDVWSDSDAGGIDLTVTETNEATGIFEGTVFFTTTDSSSGHRLRVAEGDTVTAEYEDNTLPAPYTRADELDITGTAFIGTVVPPLERAPASNPRVVDSFGNTLDSVSVDQQVQITADLTNGQDREQPFAYLVQITNEDGVTVSLAWITGSLAPGQSFSPALSWTPSEAGTYTGTVFVWESVENPTALSPPVSVDITVS
ncbi:hypothetical protein [Candidatus Nitrosotenuis uzonensis]|uniref:Uncharacterized protein n=1 Tax=Candidatus Nitrosotenuis uzonensis TaxID=1407055 RepID=A0A812ETR5_9ARCH|nr:hypothetical protein [Candidatus Nitrosotenuis uzonensis]CAE6486890.1 conserved exported hypothetical protein [Candidatus Nitrosotenuis uzonensis]